MQKLLLRSWRVSSLAKIPSRRIPIRLRTLHVLFTQISALRRRRFPIFLISRSKLAYPDIENFRLPWHLFLSHLLSLPLQMLNLISNRFHLTSQVTRTHWWTWAWLQPVPGGARQEFRLSCLTSDILYIRWFSIGHGHLGDILPIAGDKWGYFCLVSARKGIINRYILVVLMCGQMRLLRWTHWRT